MKKATKTCKKNEFLNKKTNSSTRKPTLISSGKNNRANDIEVELARGRDLDLKRSPMDKVNVNPKKTAQKSSKTINPPKKVDNLSYARGSELKQRMKRNAEWDAKMNAKTKKYYKKYYKNSSKNSFKNFKV